MVFPQYCQPCAQVDGVPTALSATCTSGWCSHSTVSPLHKWMVFPQHCQPCAQVDGVPTVLSATCTSGWSHSTASHVHVDGVPTVLPATCTSRWCSHSTASHVHELMVFPQYCQPRAQVDGVPTVLSAMCTSGWCYHSTVSHVHKWMVFPLYEVLCECTSFVRVHKFCMSALECILQSNTTMKLSTWTVRCPHVVVLSVRHLVFNQFLHSNPSMGSCILSYFMQLHIMSYSRNVTCAI